MSSQADGSDKAVLSRSVKMTHLKVWGPPDRSRLQNLPDHFLEGLEVNINQPKASSLNFTCEQNLWWDMECQDEATQITGIAWANGPYVLGIVITTPDNYSSLCLFKADQHPKIICDAIHTKNQQTILETKREYDRPLGWQVSIQRDKSFEPVLKEEVEIVELELRDDRHKVEDLHIKVNYSNHALDFNCYLDRSSILYGPSLRCSTTDSRGIDIENTKIGVIDDYAIRFSNTVEDRMTSWCFFKTSEHDASVCKAAHSANFGVDTDEGPEVISSVTEPSDIFIPAASAEPTELEVETESVPEEEVVVSSFNPLTLSQTLLGSHSQRVSYLQYSPNGKYLASASKDATIKIWDAAQKQELRTLSGHQDWVNAVSFGLNSRTLASASDDKSIRVWNVASGEELYSLLGHESAVYSVAFNPSQGESTAIAIVSGDSKGVIKFWDLGLKQATHELQIVNDSYVRAIFSPKLDSWRVLFGGGNNQLSIYNAISIFDGESTPIGKFIGHSDGILLMAFSPDGEKIASVAKDSTVRLWNVASQQEEWSAVAHIPRAITLAFHPDGKYLATGGDDNTIKIWEVATGELVRTLFGHEERVLALAFSPDGHELVSGSYDTSIRLWRGSD